MAFDWLAVVSNGTYPTPTPTATQRAAYAVSYGLLSLIPDAVAAATYAWINKNTWASNLAWPWRKIFKV